VNVFFSKETVIYNVWTKARVSPFEGFDPIVDSKNVDYVLIKNAFFHEHKCGLTRFCQWDTAGIFLVQRQMEDHLV
jgi:hypothetical protein